MGRAKRDARIQQLFLEVARVPASDRDQWLREHCDGDDQLLAEVRSLLQYDDLPVDPLESGLAFSALVLPPGFDRTTEHPVVPGYKIVREIGTGGQAIVFEAVQESTTQRVALKMLRWGQMASVQERERLRREVVILAQLSHPGIVSIIDCGETGDGVFFIVTQYVDGHRLDELLELSASEAALFGTKSQDEYCTRVLRLFLKLCEAVDAAHRHGVVHRDLKPGNILIDRLGEPRVLDFGLAKPSLQEQLSGVDVKSITTSGQFMGSLPWASPEQAAGETVDARSDVYSLGVILYQLLSGGEFPYDVSGSMGDVITKIMHADPTPLEQVVHAGRPLPRKAWPKVELVDPALSALVMKALTKSREDRYQTAREFSQAIETYLGIDPDSDPTDRGAKRRSSKGLLVAAACGVAIVAGLLAAFRPFADVMDRRADAPPPVLLDGMSEELAWNSFDQEMTDLAEDEFITRTNDSWRIRQREVRFSELSSDMLVLRAVLRRNSQGRVRLQLQSRDGTKVGANVSRKLGTDTDIVSLDMSARDFIAERIELPSGTGNEVELALAVLPDRITLTYNGRVAVQMHCRPASGAWTPVLDVKSADIDCLALEYAQPGSAPAEFFADVAPVEAPVVEFIVRHGGAALSQPKSLAANATFHLTSLTTDDSSESVATSEIAKIMRCDSLTKLKLQHLSEPREAVEQLATLKKLTHLDIGYCQLDGDCFSHFGKLEQLESLTLFRTPMKTADVRPLQQLRSLESLWLKSVSVSDADLEILANIKSLRSIGLLGEQVSSKGVNSLLRLPELKWIDLPGAKLSGEGIRFLPELSKLWHLDISGSDISDTDIPSLKKMTKLHRLIVNDTQLTEEGVDTLRTALPNCDVRFAAD